MFCTKCGTKNPPKARFCYECGSKIISKDRLEGSFADEILTNTKTTHIDKKPFLLKICITFIFCSSLMSVLLTFGGFAQFEHSYLHYRVEHYWIWKYSSLGVVGFFSYKLLQIGLYLMRTKNKNAPKKSAESILKVFVGGSVVIYILDLIFIGFNIDHLFLRIFRFIFSGVIIAIICGYLMMSKKLSLYYHWDAGPYLLKFNTVFSDAELGETYLRIKRQVDSFSYKSEDLNGAPVFEFNDGLAAVHKHNSLYIYSNKDDALSAVNSKSFIKNGVLENYIDRISMEVKRS